LKEQDVHKQFSIVDILDEALLADNKSFQTDKASSYSPLRPSSAGKCGRELEYKWHEHKGLREPTLEEQAPNTIRLLSLGHHIERSLISNLYKMKENFNIQVKYKDQIVTVFTLEDGTIIQGEIDFALEGSGFKILGDAKSAKDGFDKVFKTKWDDTTAKWSTMKSLQKVSDTCWYAEDAAELVKELKDDFKVNNILQCNLYLGSPFFQERGYEHGALYYYVKNDSRLFELRFKYSEKLKDIVKKKYQKVYDSKEIGSVPKDFKLGSIRCAFCAFASDCWSDDDPLKAWFKTFPKKSWPKDIPRLKNSKELKKLFTEYLELENSEKERKEIEQAIVDMLIEQKVRKVRLETGEIFDLKLLKSPREHFELRRGKL
jgi:hypothetical protein